MAIAEQYGIIELIQPESLIRGTIKGFNFDIEYLGTFCPTNALCSLGMGLNSLNSAITTGCGFDGRAIHLPSSNT